MSDHQERINYTISPEGVYSAHFVNHPITLEGDSLEEMKQNSKDVFRAYLEHLTEMFQQSEPFEYAEYPYPDRKPPTNNRAITGPYAGAVCPKCGQGMNHKQNITLSEKEEARDRKRYGRGICDDCKTERQLK